GSRANPSSERLVGAAHPGSIGHSPAELLPLAQGRSLGASVTHRAVASGTALRSTAGGEAGSAGLRPPTCGATSPRAGLADGGRGRDLFEPIDGVPDLEGRESGVPVAAKEQAPPRGGREGQEAE